MAEIRINATGGVKLYDADDSHYAQILAGTISSNVDALTLGSSSADFNIPVKVLGTTPTLTIGDAGAEDTKIVFDGNAQDFYIALDDSADDLLIGLGSTVGTTPAISIDENLAVKTYGDITMTGTTPTLTIGDAGAEDTTILFDGNAQDFYVGLDDTDDDLKIGLGSAVGTTPVITMTGAGAVNFGVDDTGYDVTMYGATAGSYLRWDESLDRLNIFGGSFRIEQVPASNSGTTVSDDSGATINIDWERGNYHWVVLDANVTKIVFQNMKRGGRYILRIEQHSSSPKTVSWGNVDDASSDFTEVRWVGGTAPTMTATAGRVDVYGFLCTRSNGRGMDGFVIAQNLTEDGTH